MSFSQRTGSLLLAASLVAGFAGSARADFRTVTGVPQSDLVGDTFNSFRVSDISGGTADRTLAWYDLDASNTSTWNGQDYSLSLYVNLYSDSLLTDRIGVAYASGIGRPGDSTRSGDTAAEASAQGYFGLVAESINWSVQLDGASSFESYLLRMFGDQPADGWDIAIGESAQTSVDESLLGKSAAPRGGLIADRTQRLSDGSDQLYFQTDIVLAMESAAVPLPGSVIMAMFGLAGLALRQRFWCS